MRRRTVIKSSALLALGAASTIGLGSCGNQASRDVKGAAATSDKVLRVGLIHWFGWSRTHIAEVKGLFEAEGIKVEQTVFDTVSAVNEALLADEIDLGWLVASDLVVLADEAPSLKFVMVADYSGDVDGIVGRGISSANEARGKKFAREDIPYAIVFLNRYLASIGLTEKDVEVVSLDVPDGAKALEAGEVDAITSYEPFLSTALKEEGNSRLFSAEGTNIIINGLAGKSPVLQSRRQDILAYMRALEKALDFTKENPDESNKIVAEWIGITPEETKDSMDKINIFDLEKNKSIAFSNENELSIANSFDSAVPILVSAGKATSEVPGVSFVDSSFIDALS